MAETPTHNIRIPDEEWHPAQIIVARKNETVTAVIRHALREEVAIVARKESGRTLSPEPAEGRHWYLFRHDTLVEELIMSDAKALERRLLGCDLWPAEWGIKR